MKQLIYIAFLSFLFSGFALVSYGEPVQTQTDSNATVQPAEAVFINDTLIDLNRQLNGLKEVVIPKTSTIPPAIEITPKGLIILKADNLMKGNKYAFELKAIANDEEVYIVEVKIINAEGKILVTTICDKIDMATGFRAEGKIYIVVVVSMILFSVIITYLFLMDRKMRKVTAELSQNESH